MKAIIIVGATGTGKTTYTKELIKKLRGKKYIYDVNAEYYEDAELPDISDFLEQVKEVRGGVIVFEEATIFFNNKGWNETLTKILIGKRHTKNFIIFVFHSLRSVPIYVLELCNYLVLFNTNDNPTLINSKFKDFTSILFSFSKVKKLYNKDIISLT